jgi:hypothetical protein
MGTHAGLELVALRGKVGQRRGQFRKHALGGGKRRFRFRYAFIDAAALFDARLDLFLDFRIFGIEPQKCDFSVGGLLLFAGDVGGELSTDGSGSRRALSRALPRGREVLAHW